MLTRVAADAADDAARGCGLLLLLLILLLLFLLLLLLLLPFLPFLPFLPAILPRANRPIQMHAASASIRTLLLAARGASSPRASVRDPCLAYT